MWRVGRKFFEPCGKPPALVRHSIFQAQASGSKHGSFSIIDVELNLKQTCWLEALLQILRDDVASKSPRIAFTFDI